MSLSLFPIFSSPLISALAEKDVIGLSYQIAQHMRVVNVKNVNIHSGRPISNQFSLLYEMVQTSFLTLSIRIEVKRFFVNGCVDANVRSWHSNVH